MNNKPNGRQVWWCWITNDPVLPEWSPEKQTIICPRCKMPWDEDCWPEHEFVCNPKEILRERTKRT